MNKLYYRSINELIFVSMKFSVGDKMLIKKTGEEGYVVSLIDKELIEVSVEGTIFPIYIDEIDHPYLRWFTQKNNDERKKKVLREQIPIEKLDEKKPKVASGIHLVFMPVFHIVEMEEQVERIKIFIINHSRYTVTFKYAVRLSERLLFSYQGLLQPFSDVYLHYIDWEYMQDIPRFEWQLEETLSSQYAIHQDVIKIKSSKLFEQISSLQASSTATFQYTLLQEFSIKEKVKEVFKLPSIIPHTPQKVRSIQDIPKYELDLHIEQLLADTKGLSNAEMVHIQLVALERYLDIAIKNRQDKMVVIHGVGKGVLRSEVHRILKENDFVKNIEAGWHAGYGFGATIVYFQYT
jgi:hypothetical protein